MTLGPTERQAAILARARESGRRPTRSHLPGCGRGHHRLGAAHQALPARLSSRSVSGAATLSSTLAKPTSSVCAIGTPTTRRPACSAATTSLPTEAPHECPSVAGCCHAARRRPGGARLVGPQGRQSRRAVNVQVPLLPPGRRAPARWIGATMSGDPLNRIRVTADAPRPSAGRASRFPSWPCLTASLDEQLVSS